MGPERARRGCRRAGDPRETAPAHVKGKLKFSSTGALHSQFTLKGSLSSRQRAPYTVRTRQRASQVHVKGHVSQSLHIDRQLKFTSTGTLQSQFTSTGTLHSQYVRLESDYRGTSLMRTHLRLGRYRRPMPKTLPKSWGAFSYERGTPVKKTEIVSKDLKVSFQQYELTL